MLRFGYIHEHEKEWGIRLQCRVLGVSESGYYRYKSSIGKPRRDEILTVEMKKILDIHPDNDNYGAPRMQLALRQAGKEAGIRRIKRIMRENGWLHEKKRRPKGITKADSEAQKAENLLNGDFTAQRPGEKLLTDITEVQCADGKLYISPIMDCFNGEILALNMDDNMRKDLVVEALSAAAKGRDLSGAILHSDRGSQYTSGAFREKLTSLEMLQSMGGTGKCYDNARMESFFATLKKEKLYRKPIHLMSKEMVKTIVFRYVFIYYNRLRIYTKNPGGLPPTVYREKTITEAA
ncbi:MAG TPA: IS3 family transposase [Acidobacteriota bacterium]|nr:IS3 family transposase [Acidobacteriota bacterium]